MILRYPIDAKICDMLGFDLYWWFYRGINGDRVNIIGQSVSGRWNDLQFTSEKELLVQTTFALSCDWTLLWWVTSMALLLNMF